VTSGNILAVDPGLQDLGWAVVDPRCRVVALGQLHQVRLKRLDKSTCRATRTRRQAELLTRVAREHRCTAIAAEAMSFAGNKFNMVLSVGLAWGVVTSIAAAVDVPLFELVPRVWQHAILGREPKDRSEVDYDEVFRRLAEFIGRAGAAAEQLAAIKPGLRNHVLDAVGVGVFAVLRPGEATRIGPGGERAA
jgi:Holliday junction resolvasome RuvABC endonuclease subunit